MFYACLVRSDATLQKRKLQKVTIYVLLQNRDYRVELFYENEMITN